jgi:hypothetical protein
MLWSTRVKLKSWRLSGKANGATRYNPNGYNKGTERTKEGVVFLTRKSLLMYRIQREYPKILRTKDL